MAQILSLIHISMVDCDLIVFVGATGIAVRAAAPYLMGKAYDPAVIVIDEQGKFVIPLLSGHLGGANEIAKTLAEGLQAVPVLTTATDGRQVFAVDTWAKAHSCAVLEDVYKRQTTFRAHPKSAAALPITPAVCASSAPSWMRSASLLCSA